MKCLTVLLVTALLFLTLCPLAGAVNITFASVDGSADRVILVHSATGTLLDTVNTSSTGVEITQDAILTFKPQTDSVLENPTNWLSGTAFPWLKTNFIGLAIIFFLAALISRRF